MIKPRPVQVIAVSSAKGGVGKSNVCINLAIAMAERGHRVVVFDAGMGLGNVDILLGLTVRQTLSDVLAGRCRLEDILIPGPSGIRIAPAPCGDPAMTRLGDRKSTRLNSSHVRISYAVFCLKKKKKK